MGDFCYSGGRREGKNMRQERTLDQSYGIPLPEPGTHLHGAPTPINSPEWPIKTERRDGGLRHNLEYPWAHFGEFADRIRMISDRILNILKYIPKIYLIAIRNILWHNPEYPQPQSRISSATTQNILSTQPRIPSATIQNILSHNPDYHQPQSRI